MATWKKVMLAGAASINDLTDVTIAGASDAQILVHDGTDFDNVSVSGDVTITNAGAVTIANSAVTTAKLAADAVTGAKIADDAINSEHYVDGSIDTAHIADSQVTLGKMANLDNMRVIGNTSGGAATPAAVTILDEDNMASDSNTALATQQSIKAYVDNEISTSGGGTVTGVDLTGDSGSFTEQTSGVTIEFATGAGITSSVGDDIDGSGNAGVKHVIDASQTAIQSILNTSLKMGRDSQNVIDFATTDNEIIFRAGDANQVKITDGEIMPVNDSDINLGSNSVRFASSFFDSVTTSAGTVQGNLTINNGGNLSVAGTSTLTGNVTASGNVTVTGNLTVNGATTTVSTNNLLVEDVFIGLASEALSDADTGIIFGGAAKKVFGWDNGTESGRFGVSYANGDPAETDGFTDGNDFTGYMSVVHSASGASAQSSGFNQLGNIYVDTATDDIYI
jgi:hypothetical protein